MTERFIGVMSGTSMDGLDLVLAEFPATGARIVTRHDAELPASLQARLRALATAAHWEPLELLEVDALLGERIGAAVLELLASAAVSGQDVRAIGSHGQTIRHLPDAARRLTLQIGAPDRIAEATGIDVIADFRRRDQAAGGEGAPLVPPFHAALFGVTGKARVIANIGGIANLSVLAPDQPVSGFDTGPGNTLLDAWSRTQLGRVRDENGAWAASGHIRHELLDRLLQDPWFERFGARSTGPEHFNLAWVTSRFPDLSQLPAADVQATLTELTAVSIARAANAVAPGAEILLCGGGRHNGQLVARLRAHAQGAVSMVESVGIDGDALEALAFAWLAHRFVAGLPGNAPEVTGARGERILGALYPGNGTPGNQKRL